MKIFSSALYKENVGVGQIALLLGEPLPGEMFPARDGEVRRGEDSRISLPMIVF